MHAHEDSPLLHSFLVASARRHGGTIAIDEDGRLTPFDQLLEQALAFAATLQAHGLVQGDRVALILPKSTEAIISLFGILIAGGIYVPIEPRWPAERIEDNLADCTPRFVVTPGDPKVAQRIPSLSRVPGLTSNSPSVCDLKAGKLFSWAEAIGGIEVAVRETSVRPEDPALILFTSGSTGRPKGVTLSHRAVAAFVSWSAREFNIEGNDRLGCPSSLNFDLSTFDIFNMALCGAACVIIPEQIVLLPRFLAQFMAHQRISAWYSVPSLLTSLLAERSFTHGHFPDLRLALFAGEVLAGQDVSRLRSIVPHAAIYNLYGPTETNVVTSYRIPDDFAAADPIPIGHACAYAELMLDAAGQEPNHGETSGDLLVAGESLMLGYWKRARETEQAFVTDTREGTSGKRFYRTGDRVKLILDTGQYIFVGRKDRQVKRRGYRIELGEIETALRRHPAILEAAVISSQSRLATTSITAFVCADPQTPVTPVEIRTHCAHCLPAYMMPDQITFLPIMPRSSRGKVDYAALATIL